MDSPFPLIFENGRQAMASYVKRSEDLYFVLQTLEISVPRSTLVLVGGASGLTVDYLDLLEALFAQVVCPIVSKLEGAIVDGGTDAGVMRLMGQARHQTQASFPLVGVVARGTVCLPWDDPPLRKDYALLDPNHTHFLLVPGALWGDEVPWIAGVADCLAASQPSLTLLVNGGKIAWQDVENSVRVARPVLVVAGSGRTADELAVAIRGDRSNARANSLVDSGLLHCIELSEDQDILRRTIALILTDQSSPALNQ